MSTLPDYAANWEIRLVDTQQDVEDFLSWVDAISGMISIDTETCGLDWTQRSFTRLVQFGDDHCGCVAEDTGQRSAGRILEQFV